VISPNGDGIDNPSVAAISFSGSVELALARIAAADLMVW
jgi:hypothetical protein